MMVNVPKGLPIYES